MRYQVPTVCEIEGCDEPNDAMVHWGRLYLCLCREHLEDCDAGKPCPPVKECAVEREFQRNPFGYLPEDAPLNTAKGKANG